MSSLSQLQENLRSVAERSLLIRSLCTNEESTKQHLVLPTLEALGYECSNPYVLQPEYAADFRPGVQDRADYVILQNAEPVIAIECKKCGTDLASNRGQLRGYFTALPQVRLGILTDGIRFEFFTDCENTNIMDDEPFVTLDVSADVTADVLDALLVVCRSNFNPRTIAEMAEMRLVSKRVRTVLMQEVRDPSVEFCRSILRQAGRTNLQSNTIQTRYGGLIRAAFEEALVMPVVEIMRDLASKQAAEDIIDRALTPRVITTDRELAVFRYACRRLAYLATDETQFAAIERVQYRDFIGKFVVYFGSVNKGRLFEFIEGKNGYDKFIFPQPYGEIETNTMRDIDEALRVTFAQRVRELNSGEFDLRKAAVA
ncbi:hypothetical protein DLM45_01150 [Hyphomicrobium methylovorum]|uniref:type I restriction enzyme HsdR N-terminal domain-containing protein n=1 Tax=Hyphomicrobium methylovorum TaxID=84 RepID=UPI0015E74922|nr:type I restriction enzyme HsdR N-terminal domain-containing protein [Hyphomicrobium methylovorum]MBA2124832.1 hypothetical protein [Hyphomicrobium methylovorum]